ncbi:MAG TPA: DUF5676 family membrane protein [Candidatus Nanoarchaeia archaeon]|nr:DUF5676 family membrane protein [Candidatus Nanoarchaeia archaeon]
MAKLKPVQLGLSLGISLVIIYILRTVIFWIFPNLIVNLARKLPYDMAFIKPAVILPSAFVTGIILLLAIGLAFGYVFALVYNRIAK